ncbi:hypothetical protein EJ04DRAFT_514650 [Polyplosphaeria fusca]|uniref:Uncharacterized protein n=1 Tax=Polyplosphaeria fusca TaxID=682080 RepID=A0A9P4QTN5_9PLEO|nr:hypothetical protein EJ04DRAFT_514650 [Polyplosphaeria fusca]
MNTISEGVEDPEVASQSPSSATSPVNPAPNTGAGVFMTYDFYNKLRQEIQTLNADNAILRQRVEELRTEKNDLLKEKHGVLCVLLSALKYITVLFGKMVENKVPVPEYPQELAALEVDIEGDREMEL